MRFCMIFSKTLLEWDIRAIVRWLEHSLMSPFVGNGMFIDLFQSVGHSHVSHIFLHRIARIFFPSPVTFISSSGISSIPGDFPLEISFMAFATSAFVIVGF